MQFRREIILVNDASTDNSEDVIINLAHKFTNVSVIRNSYNAGAGHSRNVGVNYALGEYIMFLDADDWVDLNYFENLESMRLNHPNSDAFVSTFSVFNEEGKLVWSKKEITNLFNEYLNK